MHGVRKTKSWENANSWSLILKKHNILAIEGIFIILLYSLDVQSLIPYIQPDIRSFVRVWYLGINSLTRRLCQLLLCSALDMPFHCAIQRCLPPFFLPLLRRLALCRPSVDGSNLLLERGVDETVPLEGVEASELGGDDERGECLTAAA